jgi:hypothetical protein
MLENAKTPVPIRASSAIVVGARECKISSSKFVSELRAGTPLEPKTPLSDVCTGDPRCSDSPPPV